MKSPNVVRINLLQDMFNYSNVTKPTAFLNMHNRHIPAIYKTKSVLERGHLFHNFANHIISQDGCDMIDKYLVEKLSSAVIDVYLIPDMPDLSDDMLCFESSTIMRGMSWKVVLSTVIIQALNDLEFCLKLHKTNNNKIVVAFKVELLADITLISVYFNDMAANVPSNNKESIHARYDRVY